MLRRDFRLLRQDGRHVNTLAVQDAASILDTLPLAYHLTGDNKLAIEMQEQAVALAPLSQPQLRRNLETQLIKYRDAATDPSTGQP